MTVVAARDAVVDGVRTHYLTAGDPADPPVLLLHGGAWGECAATAWSETIPALAACRRVIAPDWLGFGRTDKLVDFADRAGRMLTHLARLLEHLQVTGTDVVALSMGGAHLLRDLTSPRPLLPVRRAVLVSAGGPPISGQARARLMDFDGTLDGMRRQVRLAFANPRLAEDDAFVRPRLEAALRPGAYEAFASLQLRAPTAPPPPGGDPVPYERVRVPVLVTAGAQDQLKPPGFAAEVARRIPGARLHVFDHAGHCPQIEAAAAFNTVVADFLQDTTLGEGTPAAASRPPADSATAAHQHGAGAGHAAAARRHKESS